MGELSSHFQNVRQQSQRQAAVQAGMHPDYGTPGGPELDPRSRQQLQDAEYAVQQARNDPNLSTAQKVSVVQAMSNKINSLDPAGRYRNGQQPMTAIQKAMAQATYTDPDSGTVYSMNPRTGEVTPHFPRPQAQQKAAKEQPQSFDDLPLKDRDAMVRTEMKEFGIDPQQALQQIRARHAALGAGGSGGGAQAAMDPLQATGLVQRYPMGEPDVDVNQARAAYQQMHPDTKWQVSEAAGDLDQQMNQWEQRRQNAMAGGAGFSMPDRATVAARRDRALALTAGVANHMVAPAPPLTAKQRQQQQADANKQATNDAKAAAKNQYAPPNELQLRAQALRELEAGRVKDDLGQTPPITPDMIDQRAQQLRDAHRQAWQLAAPGGAAAAPDAFRRAGRAAGHHARGAARPRRPGGAADAG